MDIHVSRILLENRKKSFDISGIGSIRIKIKEDILRCVSNTDFGRHCFIS